VTPAATTRFWWDAWQTASAAQATIALRVWAFASPAEWESSWGRGEMTRMVTEKQQAMLDSACAMQRALFRRNSSLLPVLHSGLRPYKHRTTSNARRLGHRR
jgi:hypothetical protein